MRLRNTNHRLPGGWRFKQFASDGRLLHEWKGNFDPWPMFLGKIRSFRVANQLARQEFVEQDVTEYLAREFGGDPRYFDGGAQKKTSPTTPGRWSNVASAGAIGSNVLKDWFGDGLKPVPTETAQARADICLGKTDGVPCPHNGPGLKLIGVAARFVQAMVEHKNKLKLSVEGEDALQSCQVCLCDLKLKVHVPMKHILSQTPDAMLEKFRELAPAKCWMLANPQPPA